jgi:hypothetical protein
VHNPLADGGSGFRAWETLEYCDKMNSADDWIDNMGADYYLDWRFRTDSDDVFAIKISATVEWSRWDTGDPENPYDDMWVYVDQTPVSLVISLANYWQ